MNKDLKVGIVGAAGRGASYISAFKTNPKAALVALCDPKTDVLERTAERNGVTSCALYSDYEEMLEKAGLDAVVVATPVYLHVEQSIMALERNIHVLSEVPAAVSVDECRELVRAVRESKATYMMGENCCYYRDNVLVREIAKAGLFGETYYGEGEYVHELRGYQEITPWRRKWQTGINGNTYPTHSLGPVYEWFGRQRVTQVCCFGSGHHYRDSKGNLFEIEDTTTTACRLEGGGLIELRLDMLSSRPHIVNYWSIQGTKGCYESARGFGDKPKIYLMERHPDPVQWHDLEELAEEFLPDIWLNQPEEMRAEGHEGSEYMEVMDFVDSILDGREHSIGVHEALDMTLPGLISQQSIAQGSIWLDVPDSRTW